MSGRLRLTRPRLTRVRLLALIVGVVAVAMIVVFATSPKAAQVSAETPLIGKPAPALDGMALDGRGPVGLTALRGRFVVVNFFAHWCPPCIAETPQLNAFASQHRAAVLGVVFDDNPAQAARWLTEQGGTYPVLADPTGQFALRYGVRSPPTSFLISPRGRVLTAIDGQVTVRGLDHLLTLARKAPR